MKKAEREDGRVQSSGEERARDEMSDPKDEPRTQTEAQDAPQPEGGVSPAPEERIAKLEEELRLKSEEAAANRDRHLRAVAEAENSRKRLQKDKSDAIRFANETLLRDLLHVVDNLELAIEHAELGGNGKSVREGVELTLRLFRDVLERHGVKELGDPTGAAFDPSTQEAAEVQTRRELPPNTVIRQQIKGYRYNDRLLRPARVVVAGGPSSSEAEPDDDEKESVH
jgi:molecular chaperone GrpE